MGKTIWRAAPWYDREQWLATDGKPVVAPTVETTPSQRRWRITGTDLSVPKGELVGPIRTHIRTQARRRSAEPWFLLLDPDREFRAHAATAGFSNFDWADRPTVQLTRAHVMPVAFEFAHPSLPITSILWVSMHMDHYGSASVRTRLTYRPTDHVGNMMITTVQVYDDKKSWKGARPVPFALGEVRFGSNPRKAAAHFLEYLRLAAELNEINQPDGRDGTTLTLVSKRTNYTKNFYREVLDIVQGEQAMQRLADHLAGVKRELSNLGIVADNKRKFDLAALLNGSLHEFQVQITPQGEDGQDGEPTLDDLHEVHLDLARGIFVVSCLNHDLDDVAEAWNVAKFKEELTGNTDVLLAYARAHGDSAEQARLKKIIRERKIPLPR